MRKISIFSLFLTALISFLSFGIFEASAAGWIWSQSDVISDKPHFCAGEQSDCSINGGLRSATGAMGDDFTSKGVVEYSQNIIINLLGFISLLAVCLILWSGFRILTSSGDEKVLEESKKTITYIAIGMIVMWLAYSIVKFIMDLLGEKTAYTQPAKTHYAFNLIPSANAQAYTESENGTFAEYRYRLQVAAEKMEAELKVNKQVSSSTIAEVKSLVQQSFDRLPDKNVTAARENESNKRLVDMYLDLAAKEPNSQQAVGQAISQVANFAQNAKIETIQGSILATPSFGNAPLVTSFSAQNVIDPSGTVPSNNNYIWWIRENGGIRRELGRGPSLTHEFDQEGTYTVNLDVVSASRNSKGRTDVLPLSTSVNVQVQPKLGEITLLINGINVSNMNEIKITPAIASQGLIFDATASRAIGNGRILETKWEFDNGNTRTYKSAPGVERQIFATAGEYTVKLSFTTNDGKNFSKNITLKIIDPAAIIKAAKTTTHAGETLSFSAETYFGNIKNVDYTWRIQNNESAKSETLSGKGRDFSYTFSEIGSYTISLIAISPNGDKDMDSKTITIESREPVATLDAPKQISAERPNTFVFDASRSFDPDTNTRQGLTYTWRINGQLIQLDEIEGTSSDQVGSKGSITFDSVGENTISVTVANQYGKIATAEQKFNVTSVLSGNVIITPQVTQVGKEVTFIAQSKHAQYYTWNMGDGSPQRSGNDRTIQHTFKKTGVYNIKLVLEGNNNSTTTINRKVYVTDMDSPFAVIDFSSPSNSIIQQSGACDGKDAYILKRGESTQISGSKSINVDGSSSNLDYTWKIMGKPVTSVSLSEKFKELGCFPITLTVKSKTNGASHTVTEYIKLENQIPTLTNITTTRDTSKQDSQKIIVKARANGATDPDGVITSYIWYYKTASDEEPQGLQITQKPEMTFVLPNITEKYYFGVIIEDNDSARVDSKEILSSNAPLIIDNENSNIHLPLINLTTSSKVVKIGQPVTLSADVKTILGTNVTAKAQYAWDFDGDGRIDERSSTSSISHTYQKAGDYKARVRVTNNGVSNTKIVAITVRNELKAAVQGYKLPSNQLYLLNTSAGVYDKAQWKIGDNSYNSLDSVTLDINNVPNADEKGSIGTLKIWSNDTENSSTDIILKNIEIIETGSGDTLNFQSFPKAENDTIKISDPAQSLKIALFGNTATNYAIDVDLGIDSDMDGITDNDVDNRETPSYTNGSLFVIPDFANTKNRERQIKLTTYDGTTPIASKTLTIIFDFIQEIPTQVNSSVLDAQTLSDFEKEHLEKLANMIRGLNDSDRIVLMQEYNILVENWMSPFEKTKQLYDLQSLIFERPNIDEATKNSFSSIIDQLLINDTDTVNAVTVAITLIRNLIPTNSANYAAMIEKVDAIASHPTDSVANKTLGEELLTLIQQEPSDNLEDKYKLLIRDQIKLIIERGDASKVTPSTTATTTSESSGGGIMSVIKSIGIIILWIIGIVAFVVILLFVWYKTQSKDENLGFQDFIIDKLSGKEKSHNNDTIIPTQTTPLTSKESQKDTSTETQTENKINNEDPLKTYTPPTTNTDTTTSEISSDPLAGSSDANMPDWLNPTSGSPEKNDPLLENSENNTTKEASSVNNFQDQTTGGLPSWLAGTGTNTIETERNPSYNTETTTPKAQENFSENFSENISSNTESNNENLPDWLTSPSIDSNAQTTSNSLDIDNSSSLDNNFSEYSESTQPLNDTDTQDTTDLPDWLKQTNQPDNTEDLLGLTTIQSNTNPENNNITNPPSEEIPDWIANTPQPNSTETPEKNNFNDNLTDFDENNFSYTSTKTETTPVNESIMNENMVNASSKEDENSDLPDWLRDSVEQSKMNEQEQEINTNSTDQSEYQSTEIIENPNISKKEEKQQSSSLNPNQDIEGNIPEWLKDDADTISKQDSIPPKEKTTEQIFEEKIESEEKEKSSKKSSKKTKKSDDDIPEWLK